MCAASCGISATGLSMRATMVRLQAARSCSTSASRAVQSVLVVPRTGGGSRWGAPVAAAARRRASGPRIRSGGEARRGAGAGWRRRPNLSPGVRGVSGAAPYRRAGNRVKRRRKEARGAGGGDNQRHGPAELPARLAGGCRDRRTVLDGHTSAVEGSIGAIPRRLVVADADAARARRVLAEAGET